MALTPMQTELSYIRTLPDRPRLSDGHTPESIKARFDRAGCELQAYLNHTLLPELQSTSDAQSGADAIGSGEIGTLPAGSVHSQLSALYALCQEQLARLQEAVSGIIPEGTVTLSRLEEDVQEKIEGAALRGLAHASFLHAGDYVFTAPRDGVYRVRMCGAGGGGSYYHPLYLAPSAVQGDEVLTGRGGAAGAYLETYLTLQAGQTLTLHVGAGGTANYSAVIEEPSDTALSETYDSMMTYAEEGEWHSAGGDTTLSLEGTLLFTCPGGNSATSCVLPTAVHPQDQPLLTGAGEPFLAESAVAAIGELHGSRGAATPLGHGAMMTADGQSLPATCGSGGHGGQMHVYHAYMLFDYRPSDGADGAVIVEYIQ